MMRDGWKRKMEAVIWGVCGLADRRGMGGPPGSPTGDGSLGLALNAYSPGCCACMYPAGHPLKPSITYGIRRSRATPLCITRILAMRSPEAPTSSQSFHLACWMMNSGYTLEECKRAFREIYCNRYVEDVADTQLKLIRVSECKPFHCFIVENELGVCSPDCPLYYRT